MKLALKVTPGAKKNEILGWEDDYPQIGRVLKVKIAAPPVEGKANKEIVLFLAKALGVTKSSIEVVHGTSGRIKLVEIPDGTDLSVLGN
ncbi:MAG: YggU family protein [Akkermansia sp.]|nr:YggU family protein [Akkermansia sp.]